jgi:flagellar motility protein MotE (MotC chaperone)
VRERAKEEAALEKERERRQRAIDRAQGALDAAHRKHEEKVAGVRARLEALEDESQAEEARWEEDTPASCVATGARVSSHSARRTMLDKTGIEGHSEHFPANM